MILDKINSPADLKKLSLQEVEKLPCEIREGLFNRLSKIGGHFGSNFGFVEATIALHYVFNSPIDKIVFDVSHQAYVHKMLTGRKAGYFKDECFSENSGFTNPEESEHDLFNIGHTSTSIALAFGLAKARDLKGTKENVIAIIGDGSLSGGEAMESLNAAGSELNSNLIIVVNDNEIAISENHGGIYKNLEELRRTEGKCSDNWFKGFGLDYIYEENGNDINSLITLFNKIKDINHPIVVHLHTKKGMGYKPAEMDGEGWHWSVPFNRGTGEPVSTSAKKENYKEITRNFIENRAKTDDDFIMITPAMGTAIGMGPEQRKRLGKHYLDVGIAEEAAVAVASGVAKNGGKPLVVTHMTFLQRSYDQVSQDVCINNSAVTFLTNYNSLIGLTDISHLGIFGLPIFSNIPNLVVLCPTCVEEYINMLNWSLDQNKHPVLILIPGNAPAHRDSEKTFDDLNKFKVEQNGEKVCVIALGDFYQIGEEICREMKNKFGFNPTLVNPRFASGIDEALMEDLKKNHQLIITLEDGVLNGGFGEKISAFYGMSQIKVKNYGLNKQFYDRYNPKALLEEQGITIEQIVDFVGKEIV